VGEALRIVEYGDDQYKDNEMTCATAGVGVSSIGVGDGTADGGISPCADTEGERTVNCTIIKDKSTTRLITLRGERWDI
jgi:hypothetical protein